MTTLPHREGVPSRVSFRNAVRHRRDVGRSRRDVGRSRRASATSDLPTDRLEQACRKAQAEVLWERHGRSAYAIACVLLEDAAPAARAVELAMADLAQSAVRESARDARRSMARHVYRRSQELSADTSLTTPMPPAMVWVNQLGQLQRACLALCLFGGHTYREAAALLGVAPSTAAALLTSGLTDIGRTAASVPIRD
jgi:DNA-directed RNA polymerase specialized sigma24 family protein